MPSCQETVAEYFAAIRAMDADRWVRVFAEDGVSNDPVGAPPLTGHDELRTFFSGLSMAFENLGLTEDHVFINGNSAAVKWTGRGKGRNGRKIEFEGVDVIDCNAEGKIALARAFWDPTPVMAALQSD